MENTVGIVGGGASGIVAGIVAAREGARVTILERNDRLGKKILATGNGRCNYTNIYLSVDNYYGENNKFAYSPLSQLDPYLTMDFFEDLGITPAVEDSGKVFPLSYQSSSVLDVLRLELDRLGVEVINDAYVISIEKEDRFKVKTEDSREFFFNKLILSTGGNAMPQSGSDGNGYRLAEGLGHKIIDTFPGLVQLWLDYKSLKEISGVKVDGYVKLFVDGVYLGEDRGDVLFTDYGISGPPILQLSRRALEGLKKSKNVILSLCLIEGRSLEEIEDYLLVRFKNLGDRRIFDALIGMVNKRLIGPILRQAGVDQNKISASITREEIRRISKVFKKWEFNVIGSQPFKFAQVTAGGVDTGEVNNKTMESKLVNGLYLTGELLDIDGDCGGFNLQWAWSTGFVAGYNAGSV